MRFAHKVKRLLSNAFQRNALEYTLDAELRAYVDEMTDRKIRQGVPREEAQRQALLEVGGIENVKEEVRDSWLGRGIEATFQDIRFACRTLLRSPGFTVVVVATLALAMSSNLTMFSLMRAVLWRPLPYRDPNRMVVIEVDARNVLNAGATRQELIALGERSRSFEKTSTVDRTDASLEYAGDVENIAAANISDDFLPLLGVRLALGRMPHTRIDSGRQQPSAILISNELWQRRFFADPSIIGKSCRVNDLDMAIVGVLAPGFHLFLPPAIIDSEQIDVWIPSRLDVTDPHRGVPLLARLRPGVTLGQANADLKTLAAQFERDYPDLYFGSKAWQASPFDLRSGANVRFTARPLHEEMTREVRPALFLLSGAVGFVLLIACVNVANLMLARGSARQREWEIRRALGAGGIRIIRQQLTESLVLATAAAALGLLGARLALGAIAQQTAWHIPLQSRIEIDAYVALFALVLSAITSVLFGLLPAWRQASSKTGRALPAGRSETAGSGARRLQRILVATEIALSIVPLVCGGLMLRSFLNLLHSPLGFDPANVITAGVPIDFKRYPTMEGRLALLRDVIDRVSAIPGVQSVSAADPLPLAGQERRRVGRPDRPDTPPILATQQFTLPGYLRVMGTPLRAGRDFTAEDLKAERAVAIIDEGLAKRLWPEGAIGKRMVVYRTGWLNDFEVIGVTSGVRVTRVRDGNVPHFMIPYSLYPREMSLVIKTREAPERIAPRIKAEVDAAHIGRKPLEVRPLSDYVSDSIGDTRFIMFVLAMFAGTSVLLAVVGLYGTLAYLTAQRTREFGIRMALGSSVGAIIAIVLKESILLSVVGTALGLMGVAAVTGAIREMLYGVRPLDSMTLLGVIALIGAVALGAASVPAWRAARIDPQTSLRSE